MNRSDKTKNPGVRLTPGGKIVYLPDDDADIPEFQLLEIIPAEECDGGFAAEDGLSHRVYDAKLIHGATLHRFRNLAGIAYSAIYVGKEEIFSCERSREEDMIRQWNSSPIS